MVKSTGVSGRALRHLPREGSPLFERRHGNNPRSRNNPSMAPGTKIASGITVGFVAIAGFAVALSHGIFAANSGKNPRKQHSFRITRKPHASTARSDDKQKRATMKLQRPRRRRTKK
jgi:hypothetical protein